MTVTNEVWNIKSYM